MTKNERGGIIAKLFIIPAGVVLMMGFFFLGYYVGKYESKTASQGENMLPMPEIESRNPPKHEEFTFYKTLSERQNRTVSIDLKSKNADTASESVKKQVPDTTQTAEQSTGEEKASEYKTEKKTASLDTTKKAAVNPSQTTEKKTVSQKEVRTTKLRYTIQVSSHTEKQTAEEDVKLMKQGGFAAHIVTSELPGKGTWYRVRVGSFTNRDAAEKLRREVQAKVGMAPIIVLE